MSKTSKTQIYAILWLDSQQKNVEEISTELKMDIEQVSTILEKNRPASQNNPIKTTSSSVGDKNKNLMIMETASKKNRSVAIMTREASTQGDELKKSAPVRNSQDNIFRPKNHGK